MYLCNYSAKVFLERGVNACCIEFIRVFSVLCLPLNSFITNKLMKTSFKKSEVSNRLIIKIDFWLFELIFRFWNNQDLSDGWLFQNHKFSVKSQDLVLWINQLGASDFLKDVFHTWCFFLPYSFFRAERQEGQNMRSQKYFSPSRILKTPWRNKKTFRRFDQNA